MMRPVEAPESYLGDGLYVRIEDGQIIFRAPREGTDHWVALDAVVLENFLEWLKELRAQLLEPN